MNLNSKENRQTIKTENDVDSNNEASFFAKNHEENRPYSTYGDYWRLFLFFESSIIF